MFHRRNLLLYLILIDARSIRAALQVTPAEFVWADIFRATGSSLLRSLGRVSLFAIIFYIGNLPAGF